jgi:hypothetical protein
MSNQLGYDTGQLFEVCGRAHDAILSAGRLQGQRCDQANKDLNYMCH